MVKLSEFWFGFNNDWFKSNNESVDPAMLIGQKYQIICWFDQCNGCPHYEQQNCFFQSICFKILTGPIMI